jgi:hypothetical protein
VIPPLPDLDRLADAVRLVAGREGFDPAPVEKDFYLTRVIWGLAEALGEGLVLKGGTCLSKVDYGFRRMSEDADFVIPWNGGTRHRTASFRRRSGTPPQCVTSGGLPARATMTFRPLYGP